MSAYQYANNPQTTLSGAVTAGATSISVASAADFPTHGKFTIIVDSEIMLVTGVAGTVWTVERGSEGTVAASHTNNAAVSGILSKHSILNAHRVDARAYGVVGDGVTDDAVALQAAVDAAPAGSILFVPQGMTVILGSAISITKPLHLLGEGATFKAGANGLDAWVAFTSVENFTVRGIKFDDDNRGRTIVDVTGSSHGTVEDCTFTGYSSAYGTSSTDSLLRISTSTDVRVRGCVFEDSGNADANLNRCITINDASCKRIFVTENTFRNVNQGVVINGTNGLVVSGNTFDTTSDNGLYILSPVQDLTVVGNYFNLCEEAIVLKGSVSASLRNVRINSNHFDASTNRDIAFEGDVRQVAITGNVFRGTAGGHIVKRGAGTCYYWSITGNLFQSAVTFAAVYFDSVETLSFVGNTMRNTFPNATTFFFRVDGTATGVMMASNLLDDTGSANAGRVRFGGTNSRVVKWGNHLVNTAHIEDSGAGAGAQGSGATASGAATSTTSGAMTTLDVSSASIDNHGYLAASTDSLTIPEGFGFRWFHVAARVSFPAAAGGSRRVVQILVNGTSIFRQDQGNNSNFMEITVGGPIFLSDGDVVTVQGYQDSGAALSLTVVRLSLAMIP